MTMPLKDGEHTQILIQIASDIGETRAGVDNLKSHVDELSDDIKDVKTQMARTVNRPECTERHIIVANSIESLKKELVAEFKKVPTGQHYPILTPERVKEELRKREEEQEKFADMIVDKKRKSVMFWITLASILFSLSGGVVVLMWKAFSYLNKIDETVNTTSTELRKEIKTAESRQPRVVYIKVNSVDAGVFTDEPQTHKISKKATKKQ
jgi:hypothetical protein